MQGSKLVSVARGLRGGGLAMLFSALASCQGMAPEPREISSAHVSTTPPPSAAPAIPEPVRRAPFVPPPEPAPPVETYTVVVNEVPVKELLFALARDTEMNVDIHPDITGLVTLNAVDQSLQQILNRLSRQLDLRYEIRDDNIVIEPDTPFVRIYRVDYVNLSRQASTVSSVATQIATTSAGADAAGGGAGAGGNNSTTTVTSESNYPFWGTLVDTIGALLAGDERRAEGAEDIDVEQAVIANPANGVLMVRATSRQHEQVQAYLDEVLASSRRQVLIEATIVEVELADDYTAGVDWGRIAENAGLAVQQSLIGGAASELTQVPFFLVQAAEGRDAAGNPDQGLSLTVRLLKEFGDTRVLSSPKIMALNNQTALLKVVENVVYFEVTSSTSQAQTSVVTSADTTAKSVSVGVVMTVTPQIDGSDQVTLIVRPTISRVADFVNDPNPALTVPNRVPQIAVREMESVLRVDSGQLAVLGGLMQDEISRDADAVPILSESETFGELFTSRENQFTKTELVIFLRPWVIRTPDVQADLKSFEPFLPENTDSSPEPQKGRFEKHVP